MSDLLLWVWSKCSMNKHWSWIDIWDQDIRDIRQADADILHRVQNAGQGRVYACWKPDKSSEEAQALSKVTCGSDLYLQKRKLWSWSSFALFAYLQLIPFFCEDIMDHIQVLFFWKRVGWSRVRLSRARNSRLGALGSTKVQIPNLLYG